MFWFISAVCNLTNLDFEHFVSFFFPLKLRSGPNDFNTYSLSAWESFKRNINFILTSASQKMLKISIEIIVQSFHENDFFSAFLFFLVFFYA